MRKMRNNGCRGIALLHACYNYIFVIEGWWFDHTRHVSTSGAVPLEGLSLIGDHKQALMYLPARSAAVRMVLRKLPILPACF